jgi:MFS family permease
MSGRILHAKFAGWRILALAIVTAAMSVPGQTLGVSVFVESFITDLSLSRDAVSLAYLVGTLLGAVGMPFVGRSIDRVGVRTAMTWIGAGFGIGLAFMGGVQGFVSLALGYGMIRFLGQGSLSLVSTVTVTHWFDRRRGLALGIMATAVSALMALGPIALNAIIEGFSWRIAWVVSAVAVWLIVIPIARFGIIDKPAVIGQLPDGGPVSGGLVQPLRKSYTRSEAIRTRRLWVVLAASGAAGMLSTALNFHQISLLGEAGLTAGEAALMFAPQVVGSSLAGLAFGALADRVHGRWLIMAAMALLGSALLMVNILESTGDILLYAVLLGAAGGASRTVSSALPPRWFGTEHIGAIQGFGTFTNVASTAIGPFGLSVVFGITGAYGPALTLAAIVPLAVLIAAMFTKADES